MAEQAPWENSDKEVAPAAPAAPWEQPEKSTASKVWEETRRAIAKADRDYLDPMLGLPADIVGWAIGKDLPGGRKWFDSLQLGGEEVGKTPDPETGAGKFGAAALGSTGKTMLEGGILGRAVGAGGEMLGGLAKTVGAKAGAQIADPAANAAAGLGGVAGGEIGKQLSPEGLEGVGEVLGGLAGGGVSGGMTGAPRARSAVDETMEQFERLGLRPTAGTSGAGGKTTQWLEGNVLPQTIGGANKMHAVAQENLKQFTKVQQEIAAKYGAPRGKYDMGSEVQDTVLKGWEGKKQEAGQIMNSIGRAFGPDDTFYPKNLTEAVLKPFGSATSKEVQATTNAPELEEIKGILEKTQGLLSFDDMKALKTKFGDMLANTHDKSVNEAQIGQMVKALDDDIEGAVKSIGNPETVKDWHYAKATYANAMQDYRQSFKKLLGTKDLPVRAERVYELMVGQAGTKSPADMQSFETVWRALGKEKQGELAGTILSHMGNTDPEKLGSVEGFSLPKFLTNYKNLSPEAKKMLFKSTGNTELERSFDDLISISDKMGMWDKLASSSKSGVGGVMAGQLMAPVIAAATGNYLTALKAAVLSIGGPWAAAQMLTNPKAVRALADSLHKANEGAVGTARSLMAADKVSIDPKTGQRAKVAE